MASRTLLSLVVVVLTAMSLPVAGQSAAPVAERAAQLERDTVATEGLYAVRRMQVQYSQFAQLGLWQEMADLFAQRGTLIHGKDRITGHGAIANWLANKYSDGAQGLPGQRMAMLLPFSPIVNMAPDGRHILARWHELSMLGGGDVEAHWEGGIYENTYIEENGRWVIETQHYFPIVAGSYADGWRAVVDDIPVVPYHYTPDTAGVLIPDLDPAGSSTDPAGVAANADGPLSSMLVENQVRNLQNIYGYYADRRMWDDVTDLFTEDGVLDIAGVGRWNGPASIRKGLEREGPAGMPAGVLNDHVTFPVIVTVSPDRRTAHARGIELGMQGENAGKGYWSVTIFENVFTWQDGTWRIAAMRLFPRMRAEVLAGWGEPWLDPVPAQGSAAPDAASASAKWSVPAFSYLHPVTGEPIALPARAGNAVAGPAFPTGPAPAIAESDSRALVAESERKLRLLTADVGSINIYNAFGNYIDDFEWEMLGQTFAEKGMREMPYAGFYIGPKRIANAEIAKWGHRRSPRRTIPVHLRMQPVIDVAPDGRSSKIRSRLFSYLGGWASPAVVQGGMYPNDQAVLENGTWKLWSVAIDEFYMRTNGQNWWTRVPAEPAEKTPDVLLTIDPPDIPLTALGQRQQGFIPGSNQLNPYVHNGPAYPGYPSAVPMWFHYVNPVSGRVPEYYWPDCATCAAFPETSLEANGY